VNDPRLANRVARLLGSTPVCWEPAHGGYTFAARWVVSMADGSAVFVKAAAFPWAVRTLGLPDPA
jgi:hypothetical protein